MATPVDFQLFVRLRSNSNPGELFAPAELRQKLVEDAQEQNTNLADVVISILARRYKVAFVPNGRRTAPKIDSDKLVIRLPWAVHIAVASAAMSKGHSEAQEVRGALSAHYGLRLPAKVKKQRRSRAAA